MTKENANIDDFNIGCLNDEIEVDKLCVELLTAFHKYLIDNRNEDPLTAGSRARGADYFLRDFIIADRRDNLFRIDPQRIRQFGGNWYIISNMEPNLEELGEMLAGVAAFYEYCSALELIAHDTADEIAAHCLALEFYQQRIDEFDAIADDGFIKWNDACPVS
ncbi:MAG: hypothetical protein C0623_12265 [Desulfuromonas sp.]|nr:MAG: hypothetical protein C0623_12265 [Desulfuromonas sp.]